MRITGRILRPSNLAERRVMLSLGQPTIRVPRGVNPYLVARRLSRAARASDDLLFTRELLAGRKRRPKPPPPRPSPEQDESDAGVATQLPVE